MRSLNELQEKLTLLTGLLEELSAAVPPTYREFASTPLTKRGCERLVQLIVECAGDLCTLAVELARQPAPYSLYRSFIEAAHVNLLPEEMALQLAEWTKLRNRLVHDYDRVDDAAMYSSLVPIQQQFTLFVKHVHDFVQAQVRS